MPNFKAPDNSLHFIESEFAHLLPVGCVQITEEEAEALRPKPDLKAIATAAINKQRDDALDAGVVFNGEHYHADHVFLTELLGRVMAWSLGIYAPADTKQIRTKDNKTLLLNRDEHIAVAAAVGAYHESCYSPSWTAKDALS